MNANSFPGRAVANAPNNPIREDEEPPNDETNYSMMAQDNTMSPPVFDFRETAARQMAGAS